MQVRGAVAIENRPGRPAALVGRQMEDGVGDLRRLAHATPRRLVSNPFAAIGGEDTRGHLGCNEAWRDSRDSRGGGFGRP